jgi:predicted DNA-binding protein (MmcQ/YjbR family)
MTAQKLTEYCLSKLGAVLDYPFGPDPPVFKAGGKMFAWIGEGDGVTRIALKCEPMLADFLRQQYPAIQPGYHMNKKHWNHINCDGSVPDDEIYRQIDHSHDLILKSLTKKTRARLEKESHPFYLFPDASYQPLEMREDDELYSVGIFTFHITRLSEHIAAHRGEYALGEIRVADYMSFNRLKPEDCAGADLRKPLILAEFSLRQYKAIDGNHRLCKAHNEGVETLQAYMLSPKQHSLFITEQKSYEAYIEYWNGILQYE